MQGEHPGSDAPGFDDPDLGESVEAMDVATLDRLPFGAVRLDAAGRVERFNATEAAQSGYGSRPTLGLDFFTGIAPCMNQPDFRGRLESGLASGRLNLRFGWTGDFSDANRALDIRVLGRAGGGCWLFIRRPG
ncbi:MAG: hypothetical protein EON47_19110 [Acetobacteraceae bacterium]|nr:MAG: hypothetical protein EON47_19110 [Acetobacteraceae bacterium]